jgi:hypothetical protein
MTRSTSPDMTRQSADVDDLNRIRKLPPSPKREASALLNMRRDLIARNAISEVDLHALDPEKQDELRVIGWAFNWDVPDDYYAAHARAVCQRLDSEILTIDAGRSWPSEGAVRAEATRRALFDRAWNVKLGITDEALALCDDLIDYYGLDDSYGATALAEKTSVARGCSSRRGMQRGLAANLGLHGSASDVPLGESRTSPV